MEKRRKVEREKGPFFSVPSGFTLVETLVAVAILMIAIAGPLTVAEKGLSASIYARDQLMASYLAQDAMEYIRNIVDTNQIIMHETPNPDNITWLDSTADGINDLTVCTFDDPCLVDTINDNITQCNTTIVLCDQKIPLLLGANGYQQLIGQSSPFSRIFYLIPYNIEQTSCSGDPGDCTAADVVVEVSWPGSEVGGGGVKLEDTIYNTPLH